MITEIAAVATGLVFLDVCWVFYKKYKSGVIVDNLNKFKVSHGTPDNVLNWKLGDTIKNTDPILIESTKNTSQIASLKEESKIVGIGKIESVVNIDSTRYYFDSDETFLEVSSQNGRNCSSYLFTKHSEMDPSTDVRNLTNVKLKDIKEGGPDIDVAIDQRSRYQIRETITDDLLNEYKINLEINSGKIQNQFATSDILLIQKFNDGGTNSGIDLYVGKEVDLNNFQIIQK